MISVIIIAMQIVLPLYTSHTLFKMATYICEDEALCRVPTDIM